jgi:acylphosphatase
MTDRPRTALRLLLTGRVQGVGFRWFTVRQARELSLAGTVANLADGRVEVEVAGDLVAVEEFKRRLRQGPPAARVTGIDEQELAATPGWTGFDVVG